MAIRFVDETPSGAAPEPTPPTKKFRYVDEGDTQVDLIEGTNGASRQARIDTFIKNPIVGATKNILGSMVPPATAENQGLPKGPGELLSQVGKQFAQGALSPMPGSLLSVPMKATQENAQQAGADVTQKTGSKLKGFIASMLLDPTNFVGGTAGAKGASNLVKGAGKSLNEVGAQAQNYIAGLRPQTLKTLTVAGANPADVGVAIGSKLTKDGIIGKSAKATFDNLMKAESKAGENVGKALKDIHGSGVAAIRAEEALKPLLEAVTERGEAVLSGTKDTAKPFEEAYQFFTAKAKENEMVSLGDVKKLMKEAGKLMNKGSEEMQQVYAELYGTLANVQDTIITGIADKAKNPALKSNLLNANKNFSLFTRIWPDLENMAAKEGAGKASFVADITGSAKKAVTKLAASPMTKLGQFLQGPKSPISAPSGFAMGALMNEESKRTLQSMKDRLKKR